ncbi:hypothetical protein Lal_00020162 [Lupinus albus]|uniref:Putative transcription regulator mTERF family n=1 Tax=Lupinus albus TaxID=3870 RepID=A0A6A5MEE8_LUPAL|nr:putative transcription regulator mTERF family [Lupinus albus]KAF1871369.1 hypothetical protein Lal_00020162 [Lupinus albus]
MVASITLLTNTSYLSSNCFSLTFHPNLLIPSFHSFSTLCPQFQPQLLFSLTKTLRHNLKSQPFNSDYFRPTNHGFFLCRLSASSATPSTQPGILFSVFGEIGIGYEEVELLLVNNHDLTVVSIDSLRSRVLSLQSLGLDHVDLYHSVIRQPTLLTAKEIDPLLCFLRDELEGQLEQSQVKHLLSASEPRFLAGFPHKVQLLHDRGVPRDKVVYVLNRVNLPKAFIHRSLDEIDRIFDFLEPFGGVSLIVKRPTLLNYDLDKQLIPRVRVLVELSGGDKDGTGKVLRTLPAILNYSVEHVEGHIRLLRSFAGLDDQEIFKIILVFPGIVTASRDRKLRPRIQFLKDCGLDSGEIFKFLVKAPLFLGHSFHENIAYKLVFLVKIGFKYRTKELTMAIGSTTRTSCENMQKVITLFLSYGFSCEDIVAMSKKQPQILQYNHTSLEKKMKYLIEEMDRDIDELLSFPAFLGYKFDDRIKLRYEVKKGVKGEQMSLNKLLTISTERFAGKQKRATAIDNLN